MTNPGLGFLKNRLSFDPKTVLPKNYVHQKAQKVEYRLRYLRAVLYINFINNRNLFLFLTIQKFQ